MNLTLHIIQLDNPTPAISLLQLISTFVGIPDPLVITDGPNIYGSAVPGGSAALTYASVVAGYVSSPVIREYAASFLGSTRQAISGHGFANTFPDAEDNTMYYYAALDSAAVNAFDITGDWVMISSVGYRFADNAPFHFTYPGGLNALITGVNTAALQNADTGFLQWGLDPQSVSGGGGQYWGVYEGAAWQLSRIISTGTSYEACYTDAGIAIPANSMAIIVMQNIGGVGKLYVARPGVMTQVVSTPTVFPALADQATPYFRTMRDWYLGMLGMGEEQNNLVDAILPGAYTPDQLLSVVNAIFAGLPVSSDSPSPPAPPTIFNWTPNGCEGAQLTVNWNDSTFPDDGFTYGYEIRVSPSLTGGTTYDYPTSVNQVTLTGAVVGQTYSLRLYTYVIDQFGDKQYSGTYASKAITCCTPYTAPDVTNGWTEDCDPA